MALEKVLATQHGEALVCTTWYLAYSYLFGVILLHVHPSFVCDGFKPQNLSPFSAARSVCADHNLPHTFWQLRTWLGRT